MDYHTVQSTVQFLIPDRESIEIEEITFWNGFIKLREKSNQETFLRLVDSRYVAYNTFSSAPVSKMIYSLCITLIDSKVRKFVVQSQLFFLAICF